MTTSPRMLVGGFSARAVMDDELKPAIAGVRRDALDGASCVRCCVR
jgi:hypothetical protein